SGKGRAVLSRLARSSVSSDLPWLGSPSMSVSFAAGSLPGQSQSIGCSSRLSRHQTSFSFFAGMTGALTRTDMPLAGDGRCGRLSIMTIVGAFCPEQSARDVRKALLTGGQMEADGPLWSTGGITYGVLTTCRNGHRGPIAH